MAEINEQVLLREVEFGLDVERFMGSTVGRYLQRRANEDREAALEALATVDAEDAKAVRALQNQVAVAEKVLTWLGEAVTAGEQAEELLANPN